MIPTRPRTRIDLPDGAVTVADIQFYVSLYVAGYP